MTSYLLVLFFGLVSTLSIQNAAAADIEIHINPGAHEKGCYPDTCFQPPHPTIAPGDTVYWINDDSVIHSINFPNRFEPIPGSGDIEPGSMYSLTFPDSGFFEFACPIHPWAQGYVSVGLDGSDTNFPISDSLSPLERAPASNVKVVDLNGNVISGNINVGDRIQIVSDFKNNQDMEQPFTYIWQIQDEEGVVVSFSYFTGTLIPGQSLNPAQSWTPSSTGTYTVQVFVWESVDNPNSLSDPQSTTITVTGSGKTTNPTPIPATTKPSTTPPQATTTPSTTPPQVTTTPSTTPMPVTTPGPTTPSQTTPSQTTDNTWIFPVIGTAIAGTAVGIPLIHRAMSRKSNIPTVTQSVSRPAETVQTPKKEWQDAIKDSLTKKY